MLESLMWFKIKMRSFCHYPCPKVIIPTCHPCFPLAVPYGEPCSLFLSTIIIQRLDLDYSFFNGNEKKSTFYF
jgi:hypothetical protein